MLDDRDLARPTAGRPCRRRRRRRRPRGRGGRSRPRWSVRRIRSRRWRSSTCGEATGPRSSRRPSARIPRPRAAGSSLPLPAMLPLRLAAGRSRRSPTPAGTNPGAVCEAVWDRTDDATLAKLADWFIGRPLSAHPHPRSSPGSSPGSPGGSSARRVYRLVVADRDTATRALQRVGVASPVATVDDPRRDGPGLVDLDGRGLDRDRAHLGHGPCSCSASWASTSRR